MRKSYSKKQSLFSLVISTKKQTNFLFLIAIIICLAYFFGNYYFNNRLMNYIAKSLVIQTFFIFLTVATLISIFYPFTIRKEINEEYVLKSLDDKSNVVVKNEEINKTPKF
jgi:hypothetical protein